MKIKSRIKDIKVKGNVILKNSIGDILKYEYRNKFWGFPIGVNELPKLDAIVSKTIIFIGFTLIDEHIIKVNGTKVIRDTSLVTIIDEKKHIEINAIVRLRCV